MALGSGWRDHNDTRARTLELHLSETTFKCAHFGFVQDKASSALRRYLSWKPNTSDPHRSGAALKCTRALVLYHMRRLSLTPTYVFRVPWAPSTGTLANKSTCEHEESAFIRKLAYNFYPLPGEMVMGVPRACATARYVYVCVCMCVEILFIKALNVLTRTPK